MPFVYLTPLWPAYLGHVAFMRQIPKQAMRSYSFADSLFTVDRDDPFTANGIFINYSCLR